MSLHRQNTFYSYILAANSIWRHIHLHWNKRSQTFEIDLYLKQKWFLKRLNWIDRQLLISKGSTTDRFNCLSFLLSVFWNVSIWWLPGCPGLKYSSWNARSIPLKKVIGSFPRLRRGSNYLKTVKHLLTTVVTCSFWVTMLQQRTQWCLQEWSLRSDVFHTFKREGCNKPKENASLVTRIWKRDDK